jgi:hypothetical protein
MQFIVSSQLKLCEHIPLQVSSSPSALSTRTELLAKSLLSSTGDCVNVITSNADVNITEVAVHFSFNTAPSEALVANFHILLSLFSWFL